MNVCYNNCVRTQHLNNVVSTSIHNIGLCLKFQHRSMIVMILTLQSQYLINVVSMLNYNVEFLPSLDQRQRKINVKPTSNQCRIRVEASILTINLNSTKLNVVSMLCATWGVGHKSGSFKLMLNGNKTLSAHVN